MHHYQRTVLRGITLLILAASFVLLILQARQQRYPLSNADSFLCTTKTVTSVLPGNFLANGNIVLDFKTNALHCSMTSPLKSKSKKCCIAMCI